MTINPLTTINALVKAEITLAKLNSLNTHLSYLTSVAAEQLPKIEKASKKLDRLEKNIQQLCQTDSSLLDCLTRLQAMKKIWTELHGKAVLSRTNAIIQQAHTALTTYDNVHQIPQIIKELSQLANDTAFLRQNDRDSIRTLITDLQKISGQESGALENETQLITEINEPVFTESPEELTQRLERALSKNYLLERDKAALKTLCLKLQAPSSQPSQQESKQEIKEVQFKNAPSKNEALSLLEKLPLDVSLTLFSYLGTHAHKFPQLNKNIQRLIKQPSFWEQLIKSQFPHSAQAFDPKLSDKEYAIAGKQLLLSNALQHNIQLGQFSISSTNTIIWLNQNFVAKTHRCPSEDLIIYYNYGLRLRKISNDQEEIHLPINYVYSSTIQKNTLITSEEYETKCLLRLWSLKSFWNSKKITCEKEFILSHLLSYLTCHQQYLYGQTDSCTIFVLDLKSPNEAPVIKEVTQLERYSRILKITIIGKFLFIFTIKYNNNGEQIKAFIYDISNNHQYVDSQILDTFNGEKNTRKSIAVCPTSHLVFTSGFDMKCFKAWKILPNGKLQLLREFVCKDLICGMQMNGTKLVVGLQNDLTKEIKERTYDFSTYEDTSLLGLADEFAHSPNDITWKGFGQLSQEIKSCIYEAMHAIKMDKNDPDYKDIWGAGEFAFLNRTVDGFEFSSTDGERSLAIELAYEKLQQASKLKLKD